MPELIATQTPPMLWIGTVNTSSRLNCSVEVGDELLDLGAQGFLAGEIAATRSFRTRIENQISIWLSHEACLGVKWKVMRCSG